MTVAIGLVCSDGVIVASDSMASAGSTAFPICKVHASPALKMVWTMAGSVYVSEEVEAAITNLATNTSAVSAFENADLNQIRGFLGTEVRRVISSCYQSALPFGQNQAVGQFEHVFKSDFLFMGWGDDKSWFLEISHDGQMNWHNDVGFSAVGSGGEFASVARTLMAHYLIPTTVSVDDGVLIAHRVIETTCRASSQWVGLPVWIATATPSSARVLPREEIDHVGEDVQAWMKIEQEALTSLRAAPEAGKPDPAIPTMEESPTSQD